MPSGIVQARSTPALMSMSPVKVPGDWITSRRGRSLAMPPGSCPRPSCAGQDEAGWAPRGSPVGELLDAEAGLAVELNDARKGIVPGDVLDRARVVEESIVMIETRAGDVEVVDEVERSRGGRERGIEDADSVDLAGGGLAGEGRHGVVEEEVGGVAHRVEHRLIGRVDEAELLDAVQVGHDFLGRAVAGQQQGAIHVGGDRGGRAGGACRTEEGQEAIDAVETVIRHAVLEIEEPDPARRGRGVEIVDPEGHLDRVVSGLASPPESLRPSLVLKVKLSGVSTSHGGEVRAAEGVGEVVVEVVVVNEVRVQNGRERRGAGAAPSRWWYTAAGSPSGPGSSCRAIVLGGDPAGADLGAVRVAIDDREDEVPLTLLDERR